MKKIVSILCAATTALTSVSALSRPAFAETIVSGSSDSLTWEIDSDGTLTINGEGYISSSPDWLDYAYLVRKLVIGEGISSIPSYAFAWYGSLTEATLPDTMTYMGYSAFEGCGSLRSINIPKGIRNFEGSEFFGCTGLTSVVIPDGVTKIGVDSFGYCSNLKSVVLPKSVTNIGCDAFEDCSSDLTIYYLGTAADWSSITTDEDDKTISRINKKYITASQIPSPEPTLAPTPTPVPVEHGDTIIASGAYNSVRGSSKKNISWKLDDKGTLTISGSGVLRGPDGMESNASYYPWYSYRSDIKHVVIENGITLIGWYAFMWYSNMETITIPNSVTDTGYRTFYGCNRLKTIYFEGNPAQWKKAIDSIPNGDNYDLFNASFVLINENKEPSYKTTLEGIFSDSANEPPAAAFTADVSSGSYNVTGLTWNLTKNGKTTGDISAQNVNIAKGTTVTFGFVVSIETDAIDLGSITADDVTVTLTK